MRELYEEQLAQEHEGYQQGIDRYWKSINNSLVSDSESNSGYGRTLINHSIHSVGGGIEDWVAEVRSGKGKTLGKIATKLELVSPKLAACLALKSVIDAVSKRSALGTSCVLIGSLIEDEVRYSKFKALHPQDFKITLDEVTERTTNRTVRRVALHHKAKMKYGIEHDSWSKRDRYLIGSKILSVIISKTGLVQITKVPTSNKKRVWSIVATQDTLDWIQKAHEAGECLSPVLMPMVHPPKKWSALTGGGYLSENYHDIPLIKATGKNYLEDVSWEEMPQVYKTTNALQETGYTIDTRVLEVVQTAWASGWGDGGLPQKDLIEVPISPFADLTIKKADMTPSQREELRGWSREAAKIHNKNAKSLSKKVAFIRTLQLAERFSGRTIYFPHNRDFRGRLYPISPFLTYQSTKVAKSLLKFAEPAPIETDEQEKCLLLHGANCWGLDKIRLSERLLAMELIHEDILLWAADPYENRGWREADSPWEMLQFSFEYADYHKIGRGFASSLICSVDGSINGTQHMSAILRDPVGAKATNLSPSEIPQDLYQNLSDDVEALLKESDEEKEKCKAWLDSGFLVRKLTKRPVMTKSYSSTRQSCTRYIDEYISDKRDEGKPPEWLMREDLRMSMFLTGHLWAAMNDRLSGQAVFMEWIKKIAALYAKENLPFTWTPPNGLTVSQRYTDMTTQRVRTTIDGSFVQVNLSEPNPKKSCTRRNRQGASPNFIHSMDTAHLDATVEENLKHDPHMPMAFVHDSYGCRAADMPVMKKNIKKTFVDLYTKTDIVRDVYEEALYLFGDATPEMPVRGNFDLNQVLDSDYFFN